MKKLFLVLILALHAHGQTVHQMTTFNTKADDFFGTDAFGFHYIVEKQALVKTDGKQRFEFQELQLGKLTRVDLKNPLLLVLFYESFNTVVLLDNQLNEVTRIDFNKRSMPLMVKAVGLASKNRLWIYDNLQQQLLLYDYQADKLQNIGIPFTVSLRYYETNFNYFLWIDTAEQCYKMDVFGKVSDLGKAPKSDMLRFYGNGFITALDGQIYLRKDANSDQIPLLSVGKSLKNFYCTEQILSIFTSNVITNFNLK
jgi:hypothetical protein